MKNASKSVSVKRALADGAYDSRENFLSENKPVIGVRSNSVAKSRGSPSRKLAVIEQKKLKPRAWSRIHRFGYRCRVEGAFSTIKRIFGEYVSAKKLINMAKEMAMKANLYNLLIAAI